MQEINLIGIISAGGSLPVLDTLNVTENGIYTPPSGVDGYNEVNVAVPTPQPALDTLNITENGTYTPPSGVDGYNEVNVSVPVPQPSLEALNVTENGTYTPPSGVDGYNEVNVAVPTPELVGGIISIANNGHYELIPDSGKAFNKVDVYTTINDISAVRIAGTNNNKIELPINDSNDYEYTIEFYNSGYQHNTSILGNANSGFNIQLTEYSNTWYVDGGNNNQLSYTPQSLNDFTGHFVFISNAIAGNHNLSNRDIALFDHEYNLIHNFGAKGTATQTSTPVWLLSRSGTGIATNACIKRFIVKDKANNNAIVCDYKPAYHTAGGVKYAGLYDEINDNFIYNSSAGILGAVKFS